MGDGGVVTITLPIIALPALINVLNDPDQKPIVGRYYADVPVKVLKDELNAAWKASRESTNEPDKSTAI